MTLPEYPPVRYHGDGEASAWVRRADAPPDLELPGGTQVHHLATGARTDGLFGLYRWEMGPGPGGAWPHLHRRFSESFHILSGDVVVYDGRAWVSLGPGDYVHVPPGGIHGFRNDSGRPASMLILFAPGAPREAYFAGLPNLADMPPDELTAFFLAHDNEYVHDVEG